MIEEAQADLRQLLRLLRPHEALGVGKVRLGAKEDGGYVVLDDFAGIETAVGCGVGWDVSFELDLARRNIPVALYDHTIEKLPTEHPGFTFHRRRVSAAPAAGAATLDEIVAELQIRPRRGFLKIDIEGAEWEVFAALGPQTLQSFRQIACELHWLGETQDRDWMNLARAALRNLNRDFAVVHIHGNNCGFVSQLDGIPVPGALEVTFANRQCYATMPSSRTFPTPWDKPNNPGVPDLALGRFAF
jgi:FkbM family methyltransferase